MKYRVYFPAELYNDHIDERYLHVEQQTRLNSVGILNCKFITTTPLREYEAGVAWFSVWEIECKPEIITFFKLKFNFMVKEYEPDTENVCCI